MKKLKLAFLWHMHQPYYKDDKSGDILFPWVFLHSIKDYYDIPWYSEKFPSIKSTFNLVPSLLEQIESYIDNSANDKLLNTLKKDIHSLDADEREYLQSYLFLSNEQNMIKPFKRYYELYLRYKTHKTINDFSDAELLDTQVLFLLSWCGIYLRTTNDTVKFLLEKKHFYSQTDKCDLINELLSFVSQIIPYYKKLLQDESISISTTPYFHPITPLLLDFDSAKEARRDVKMPSYVSNFKDYGIKNTKYATQYYKKLFGKQPNGFWPAEGSVSLKTAELFSQNSLKWFCSDEDILFRTLNNHDRRNIYKNYIVKTQNGDISVRFRDHALSDSIGFDFSKREPKEAAKEFVSHLENIYDNCDFSPLVNVILDGENAWEFFPNNAYEFFNELYKLLESTSWIETLTMDEVCNDKDIVSEELNTIASGSWIKGNFDIWIGSDEKNKAWELLSITKDDFEKHKSSLDSARLELIEKEFMVALGSDWFWWYGDDHFTVQAKEFDSLFRTHLVNIYNYMDIDVPKKILTPIIKDIKTNTFHEKPTQFIYPKLDGIKSDYFEWLHSGVVDIKKEFSVMNSIKTVVEYLRYGYNKENIYLLLEGEFKRFFDNTVLILEIDSTRFDIVIKKGIQSSSIGDIECIVFCMEENIEIEIKKKNIKMGDSLDIKFLIQKNDLTLQTFPIYDQFSIILEDHTLHNWFV